MSRKTALLDLVNHVHDQEQALIEGLSKSEREEVGSHDSWSVKDLVAHISFWDDYLAQRIHGHAIDIDHDLEEQNRSIYNRYHADPWQAIMALRERAHTNLVRAVEDLAEADLESVERWDEEQGAPLWRHIASIACSHSLVHCAENYHQRGLTVEAMQVYEKALTPLLALDASPEWQAIAYYNLSCGLALQGEKDQALDYVALALRANPSLVAWSQQDEDLASLHADPAFRSLIAELSTDSPAGDGV